MFQKLAKPFEDLSVSTARSFGLAADCALMACFIAMMKTGQKILQFPVAILMAAYYSLTAIVGPIMRPFVRALAKLRVLHGLKSAIERLDPYSSLILLAVPIVIIEPLKIGAVAILASGRVLLGLTALVFSHGLSLIIIERLFAVVKPKLVTLPWFAALWSWLTALRVQMLLWLHATWAWSVVERSRKIWRAFALRFGISPN